MYILMAHLCDLANKLLFIGVIVRIKFARSTSNESMTDAYVALLERSECPSLIYADLPLRSITVLSQI